jgi:hypothetical protein
VAAAGETGWRYRISGMWRLEVYLRFGTMSRTGVSPEPACDIHGERAGENRSC